MNEAFNIDERLLRAVFPPEKKELFWKGNRLTSAAFKDKRGLSVDRTGDRDMIASVDFMKTHLDGYIFSLSIIDCYHVHAEVKYLPTINPYHCEIHRSPYIVELDDDQALYFAENAICEYSPHGL